jgi:hypothetical protein
VTLTVEKRSPQPSEGDSHRLSRLRRAIVRAGFHGDFSVCMWFATEAEAEEFARSVNDKFRRQEAEGDAP